METVAKTQGGASQNSCGVVHAAYNKTFSAGAMSVYSDVMKSKPGTADGKVWISKARGLILQQDVEVDMGAKGKGKQTMLFSYKK